MERHAANNPPWLYDCNMRPVANVPNAGEIVAGAGDDARFVWVEGKRQKPQRDASMFAISLASATCQILTTRPAAAPDDVEIANRQANAVDRIGERAVGLHVFSVATSK